MQTKVDHELALQQIVDRIVKVFRPEKIILFGSLATGRGGPDSDADILVVMPVAGSRRQKAIEVDLALEGIPIPIDLIVVTPRDVQEYRDVPGSIIHEAVHEGRALYERAA